MPEELDELYARVAEELTARAAPMWGVALALHRDPEPSFEEVRAARMLTGQLEREGFSVERGVAGLPTSFVARTGDGDGPRVALLLEYDALPGLGHACGHHLIAAAGLGAGLALREALAAVSGSLLVVGTPAEERGGGKVAMTRAGVFEGADAALMFHPGVYSWSWAPLTASSQVRVAFHGRAAHPTGNPTEGVDALAALIQLFNTLAVLGRRLPSGSHVQGIVTEGGKATNIVPDYAEGLFGLRGATTAARDELADTLTECAQGVARATGTRAESTTVDAGYDHFRNSAVLSSRFTAHLARAGLQAGEPTPGVYLGSSDVGTVSTSLPTIHPFLAITGADGSDHTPKFAAAGVTSRAREVMLAAAQALACTAADVLVDPDVTAAAWAEHRHPDG
ncbi:amidohydrolase [Actinacidiphila glaucinigra]|uniref:Peptidase M20 domain-containing protein 2 n=1 Tax=Actinacidiphila glaucinigra TaxID=235986 RepID=A0A239NLA2_9ACTN|nr:amidohydrolase [Actinacidiphila glaucinigra]SNT55656.1 amidohydrolase [Actinacidiphila glaucinigra]